MEILIQVLQVNRQITMHYSNNKIRDFGYQCKSCIYCQASVSLLSQNVINLDLKEVLELLKQSEFFFEKKDKPYYQ